MGKPAPRSVALDDEMTALIKHAGSGNLSEGVRRITRFVTQRAERGDAAARQLMGIRPPVTRRGAGAATQGRLEQLAQSVRHAVEDMERSATDLARANEELTALARAVTAIPAVVGSELDEALANDTGIQRTQRIAGEPISQPTLAELDLDPEPEPDEWDRQMTAYQEQQEQRELAAHRAAAKAAREAREAKKRAEDERWAAERAQKMSPVPRVHGGPDGVWWWVDEDGNRLGRVERHRVGEDPLERPEDERPEDERPEDERPEDDLLR